jgi:hypothetical protein
MRKRLYLVIALMTAGGCQSGNGSNQASRDSLTRRQRDSIHAASKLPGARAVGAALNVSDAAAARVNALDSIR